ncbi:MAG: exosortase family protein XrtG [Eubacterium sp.]|nr:exosortase family protein XrtG [Eubacterium sp.]
MLLLEILGFVIWLYIVWTLKRANLKFFRYLIGSVGVFIFMLLWVEQFIVVPMMRGVAFVSGAVGEVTGMYDSYYQYCMLFIPKNTASISLYVDFECSGVIEIMAFLALLWFFEIYTTKEKIKISILGILFVFAANVIRIFTICTIIYFGGNDWFYFAHSIFGRIVFYALTIYLYFSVFTKPHIKRQKVGQFSYEKEEEDE